MALLKANQSLQYSGNDSVFSICLAAYGSFGLHCYHLFRFLLTLHSSFLVFESQRYAVPDSEGVRVASSTDPELSFAQSMLDCKRPRLSAIPWALGALWVDQHPIMATIFVQIHQKSMVTP